MKTLFNSLFLCAALLLTAARLFAQDQNSGDLKVTVLDEKNQPMPGAVVTIVAGGPQLGGQTNMDGNYTFRALSPGSYDVQANMLGYKKFVKQGIVVNIGQTSYATYNMQLKGSDCDTCNIVVIKATRGPIDGGYSTVENIDADEVKRMPVEKGNVMQMVVNTCSSCTPGANGGVIMRGARENATAVYVDGEKVYGSYAVPGGAIQQVTVLSGGVPAAYGDLTGGAVIITTKSYYTGMAEKETRYEEAAEEKAAQEKAAKEKSGQHTETNDQIIEKEQPATPPAQQEAPAPQGGN